MSASLPDRAALAALALCLAGCPTQEVEPTPFRLDVRVEDGSALADGYTAPTIVGFAGTAHRLDATTLRVAGTEQGNLTLTFERAAAPDLAFPEGLEGRTVTLEVFVDPGGTGPRGEPLRIPGYRIATAGSYDFVLGEWTFEDEQSGAPALPPSFTGFATQPDLPLLDLGAEWNDWEASECGLVYYLPLFAVVGFETVSLDRGDRRSFPIAPRSEDVQLLHVLSYDRRGACDGRSSAWSQIAAWRETAIQR